MHTGTCGTCGTCGRRRGSPGAFTLIEILMALMVLSIGLASVLSVFVVGVRASRDVVDESASAVAAKAALARLLSEDIEPVGNPDGRRDFLEIIELARNANSDWVWLHNKASPYSGTVGTEDEALIPIPEFLDEARSSRYRWRGRASRYRGDPADPSRDLDTDGAGSYVPLAKGRVPEGTDPETGVANWRDPMHPNNPDNDEIWRVTIEIYRDFEEGDEPLASFDTFVCTAHR